MTTLVAGASGATGRLLVRQLLDRGQQVKVIVRSAGRLPAAIAGHANLSVIEAGILDLSDAELARHVRGCGAVASCLGHNLTMKGLFGSPRRLVAEATRRLCGAIKANESPTPTRFVLMNTTGCRNPDRDERVSPGHKGVILLLRLLLPPHVDNEQAAEFLRVGIGQHDDRIEWVAVRPDNLIDADEVSGYDLHPSPTRSAIFDSGKTSRINVGHFMASLIAEEEVWTRWKGQMPVIYNSAS